MRSSTMKKRRRVQPDEEITEPAEVLPVAQPPARVVAPETKADACSRVVYSWPSRSRCPRCRSLNTLRTADNGSVQYRTCQVPVCGAAFKVIGGPA